MTTLAEALLSRAPRETSGGKSGNRFDYQRTWTICHMLALHASDADYVVVIEHHDDVLVLDSPVEPRRVDFYQIKTKSTGTWTRAALTKPKERKKTTKNDGLTTTPSLQTREPSSFLGKLADHRTRFGDMVGSLNFVSNARFKVVLSTTPKSEDRESISLTDLEPKELAKVVTSIKGELGDDAKIQPERFFLSVHPMGPLGHQTYGTGALSEFLENWRPDVQFSVGALFRTLFDEVSRRAGNEWQPVSFDELCEKKGIAREQFTRFLELAMVRWDPERAREEAISQLAAEGVSYRECASLTSEWRTYDVRRMDRTNQLVQGLRERVTTITASSYRSHDWDSLRDLLSHIESKYESLYGTPDYPMTSKFLKGAIIYELKSLEAGRLPPADAKPEDEAP